MFMLVSLPRRWRRCTLHASAATRFLEQPGVARRAPHSRRRVWLRHRAAVQVGSSQAITDSEGTDGSPGAKEGPWRIRTVGTTLITTTQAGVVGTVIVTASVDVSASKGATTALAAAVTRGETTSRITRKGVLSARVVRSTVLAASVGTVTTGEATDVMTGTPPRGGPAAAAGDPVDSATARGGETRGTDGMTVAVVRRSVSAFPNPTYRTTLSPGTSSEAPGVS